MLWSVFAAAPGLLSTLPSYQVYWSGSFTENFFCRAKERDRVDA